MAQVGSPHQLQRCKPRCSPPVYRLYTLSLLRLDIVHRYSIDTQLDYCRSLNPKPAQGQLLEQAEKEPDPVPRETGKEPLDCMGWSHISGPGLDGSGIALILFQLIEIDQVGACTVDEEIEELFEEGGNLQSLPALAHKTEQAFQMRNDIDSSQIAHEQTQASLAGEGVVCDLYVVDDWLRGLVMARKICPDMYSLFVLSASLAAPVVNFWISKNLAQRVFFFWGRITQIR